MNNRKTIMRERIHERKNKRKEEKYIVQNKSEKNNQRKEKLRLHEKEIKIYIRKRGREIEEKVKKIEEDRKN